MPPQQPCEVTKISSVLKSTSDIFSVCGTVKWKGETHIPSNKTDKMVRNGTLTDSSGSIPISIWGECITLIEESKFYNITNCRLCYFYGKCLTTTLTTKLSPAKEQNISEIVEQRHENSICCPEVLNVAVNSFLACNNRDCKKRSTQTQDQKL